MTSKVAGRRFVREEKNLVFDVEKAVEDIGRLRQWGSFGQAGQVLKLWTGPLMKRGMLGPAPAQA